MKCVVYPDGHMWMLHPLRPGALVTSSATALIGAAREGSAAGEVHVETIYETNPDFNHVIGRLAIRRLAGYSTTVM